MSQIISGPCIGVLHELIRNSVTKVLRIQGGGGEDSGPLGLENEVD